MKKTIEISTTTKKENHCLPMNGIFGKYLKFLNSKSIQPINQFEQIASFHISKKKYFLNDFLELLNKDYYGSF